MSRVKVGIKVRPVLETDIDKIHQWDVKPNQLESINGKHNVEFETIFNESAPIVEIYNALAQPIVYKALEGINGTVLAYGQTSSGKTHTMIGDKHQPGIIPLAVADIFGKIKENKNRQFLVSIGYIEIYNEKIFDLFENRKPGLNVFEIQGQAVIHQKEFAVASEDEVRKRLKVGNKCKKIVATSSNEHSSRSHTIFKVTIKSLDAVTGKDAKQSSLFLVDLAGSEKPDMSSPTFVEGLHINKSLLVLGKIIRELAKKSSSLKQVNFRESKLTRILSPALGGNSLTAVICTVSPVALEETFQTLCFARNAMKTKTHPTFNFANRARSLLKVFERGSPASPSSHFSPTVCSSSKKAKRLKFDESATSLTSQLADSAKKVKAADDELNELRATHEKANKRNEAAIQNLLRLLNASENRIIGLEDETAQSLMKKDEEICVLKQQLATAREINEENEATLKSYEETELALVEENKSLRRNAEFHFRSLADAKACLQLELSKEREILEQKEIALRKATSKKLNDLHAELREQDRKIAGMEDQLAKVKENDVIRKNEELRLFLQLEKHYGDKMKLFFENSAVLRLKIQELHELLEKKTHELNFTRWVLMGACQLVKTLQNLLVARKTPQEREILRDFESGSEASLQPPANLKHLDIEVHAVKGVFCPYCNITYMRKVALKRHMQNKHWAREQRFECGICHGRYKTRNSLNTHSSQAHDEESDII